MRPPKRLTVQVDSREKIPFLFPATTSWGEGKNARLVPVHVEVCTLDAGDYRLAEYPTSCVIERKGTASELWTNLFSKDSERQARAFARLSEAADHAYLFLHAPPHDLIVESTRVPDPAALVHRMAYCIGRFGLHLVILPTSHSAASTRLAGTLALNILVGHAEHTDE